MISTRLRTAIGKSAATMLAVAGRLERARPAGLPLADLIAGEIERQSLSYPELATRVRKASGGHSRATPQHVGCWCRGEITPQPDSVRWLAVALRISLDVAATAADVQRRSRKAQSATAPLDDPSVRLAPTVTSDAIWSDAYQSARLAREVAASNVSRSTLEQLDSEVRAVAYAYVSRPLSLFVEVRELSGEVFRLLQGRQQPDQARHLYLLAARLCGLQTHLALDLGRYDAAEVLAGTALLCADMAGHQDVRAWIRSIQSLIAYWDGRASDAMELARDGLRSATSDDARARLSSLEARACASLGSAREAMAALSAAEEARVRMRSDDGRQGLFAFPLAKQLTYSSTTYLSLGGTQWTGRAVAEASRALELYQRCGAEERSLGDVLAARLDIATGHLEGGEMDGALAEIEVVLATPPHRCSASIVKRLTRLRKRLAEQPYDSNKGAAEVRERIDLFRVRGAGGDGGNVVR